MVDQLMTFPREDVELPSYRAPGWLLVVVEPTTGTYAWDYDVLGYDGGSSVFWISEGTGFDYWLDQYVEFPGPGTYLLTGIVGEYVRGDGWETDDYEDWTVGDCRFATADEIAEYGG